jgi:hypothetical protein
VRKVSDKDKENLMTTIVGFLLGYVFAWKLGPPELAKSRTAWADIRKSEMTKSIFGGASVVISALLRQGLDALINQKQSTRRRR